MYTLALAIGRPNPDSMLEEMQPFHLLEWKAYYNRHPWGELRADTRAAINTIALNAALGGTPIDIAPLFPYPRKEDNDEEQVITGKELAERYNANRRS